MKDSKKVNWIIGTSGVVLSAFLLTQINDTEIKNDPIQQSLLLDETISGKEKELLQLDWTNFDVQIVQKSSEKSDRKTRRT